MKKYSVALLYSLVAVAVTLIAFFLILVDVEKVAMHYLALGGVVLAELITAAYAVMSNGKPRAVAATTVSVVMIPLALVLGVIYVANFEDESGTFLGWYAVLTLLVNVTALALLLVESAKSRENAPEQMARDNREVLRKLLQCVLLETGAKTYQARLRAMDDQLHFTLGNRYTAEDETIRQMLIQLQTDINGPAEQVEAQLAALEKVIQRRAIMNK